LLPRACGITFTPGGCTNRYALPHAAIPGYLHDARRVACASSCSMATHWRTLPYTWCCAGLLIRATSTPFTIPRIFAATSLQRAAVDMEHTTLFSAASTYDHAHALHYALLRRACGIYLLVCTSLTPLSALTAHRARACQMSIRARASLHHCAVSRAGHLVLPLRMTLFTCGRQLD